MPGWTVMAAVAVFLQRGERKTNVPVVPVVSVFQPRRVSVLPGADRTPPGPAPAPRCAGFTISSSS